uniref:Uncharacterized protein n=1 Tax=Cannabis sativa TaxID=3483 RepID=A0A803NFB9_CANSA
MERCRRSRSCSCVSPGEEAERDGLVRVWGVFGILGCNCLFEIFELGRLRTASVRPGHGCSTEKRDRGWEGVSGLGFWCGWRFWSPFFWEDEIVDGLQGRQWPSGLEAAVVEDREGENKKVLPSRIDRENSRGRG